MEQPSPDIQAVFAEALRYQQQGDAYNAIKLYKKVTRLAPSWAAPWRQLGEIYRQRREWKPALHYYKKAVALDTSNQDSWWNLGLSATALKKWRLARSVWKKFGFPASDNWQAGPVFLRLACEGRRFEIMSADSLDPVRAVIKTVPHPDSGRHFNDVVLVDREVSGHFVVQNRRFPIHDELGLFRGSGFQTFSCVLHTARPDHIELLGRLCGEAELGFEVWSNSARQYAPSFRSSLPEYYSPGLHAAPGEGGVLVALAARREKQVLQVLNSWQVISLNHFSGLERHR